MFPGAFALGMQADPSYQLAGDVIQGPWNASQTHERIMDHKLYGPSSRRFNPLTGRYEESQGIVLPMVPPQGILGK